MGFALDSEDLYQTQKYCLGTRESFRGPWNASISLDRETALLYKLALSYAYIYNHQFPF